ncbi:MAG: Gfo/Idh/MocA family oxidoreductase [Segetibacter sp.]
MDDIKFAIGGCGRIAQRHAEQINKVGILKAVCDIDDKRAFELGNKYNAASYHDFDEMLVKEKEVCVVSVCTPNGLHAQHSIKALNAGFHVLCEKPMANNVKDCYEMIDAAERAGRQLMIVKQNRFNPPVAAVKSAIDKGIFGKIYSIQLSCFWNRNPEYYQDSWKGSNDLDGGTLYTQFSHFIDLLYWMIGDVKRAYALTGNFAHKGIIDFEDTGVVALEFNNGALGTINYTVNSYNKNMEGSLTFFAEKGTVKIGGQYLNELEYQNVEGFEFKDIPRGSSANNYGSYSGSMSNHDKVYKNLIDVLVNGSSVAADAYEGLKTVDIIERIYQSSKQLCI